MVSNKGSVVSMIALALPVVLGGRAMLGITPAVGAMLLALGALCLLLALELALGTPFSGSWAARSAKRRQARRDAQEAADRKARDAAFEAGLEVTRAYGRELARNGRSVFG